MDTYHILYEDWQMQCCGIEFSTGGTVRWPVAKWDTSWNDDWDLAFMQLSLGTVGYVYDAHSSKYEELSIVEGIVDKIYAIYASLEPHSTDSKMNIRLPRIAISVNHADGWDEDVDSYTFSSYFVILKDSVIRQATQTDITFK